MILYSYENSFRFTTILYTKTFPIPKFHLTKFGSNRSKEHVRLRSSLVEKLQQSLHARPQKLQKARQIYCIGTSKPRFIIELHASFGTSQKINQKTRRDFPIDQHFFAADSYTYEISNCNFQCQKHATRRTHQVENGSAFDVAQLPRTKAVISKSEKKMPKQKPPYISLSSVLKEYKKAFATLRSRSGLHAFGAKAS